MNIVSVDQLVKWAVREVRSRTGPARACTRPYPDRDGPTLEHMDAVRNLADQIEQQQGAAA